MKKGQICEGIVKRVDFPNKGVIEVDEKKVVVKNCIPGQKVSFAVNRVRSGRAEGRLIEVLEDSPLETRQKQCKQFGSCGGCTYQTLSYENQLELKKQQVKKLIDEVCPEYTFEGILGSPVEWGYRNKMEYSFGDEVKDGPLTLGLHKKGSFHDILNADDCCIVDKDFNMLLTFVLQYFSELGADYYHKNSHTGYLRHLLIRKTVKTGEILINIITSTQVIFLRSNKKRDNIQATNETETAELNNTVSSEEKIQEADIFSELVSQLRKLPLTGTIAGILHTYNDSLADAVINERTELLYGRDYITEELLGLQFKISTFSFFQTNSRGAEVLYSKVREYVGETKDKRIFDLYSGTGTIAQLLAPVASKVTGIEIVEEAVEAARENAALNGLTNCDFIAGDVLKAIDELQDKPDIIILDPPRDGIHPKALEKIINFGVEKIVYISCKPTSLARDLEILQNSGYKVEKVCAVDMFPETVHVETVVMMSKAEK